MYNYILIVCLFLITSFASGSEENKKEAKETKGVPAEIQEMVNDEIFNNLANKIEGQSYGKIEIEPRKKEAFDTKTHQVLPLKIEYYEIPMSLLQELKVDSFLMGLDDSLKFQDSSKKWYVRWFINPEDDEAGKVHLEIAKMLKAHGFSSEVRSGRFDAYLTASRSMIIHDLVNSKIFSIKVGSKRRYGRHLNLKTEPAISARVAYEGSLNLSELIANQRILGVTTSHEPQIGSRTILQPEPLVFCTQAESMNKTGAGLIVRSLAGLTDVEGKITGNKLVPAFAFVNRNKFLKIYNETTGSTWREFPDDEKGQAPLIKFLSDNFTIPIGKALAELVARTPHTLNLGGHGQNILLQLDSKGRPTGKIVFRDFNDENERLSKDSKEINLMIKLWDNSYNLPLKGVTIGNFKQELIANFMTEFSQQTGIPLFILATSLNDNPAKFSFSFKNNLNKKNIPIINNAWNEMQKTRGCFLENLAETKDAEKKKNECKEILSSLRKKQLFGCYDFIHNQKSDPRNISLKYIDSSITYEAAFEIVRHNTQKRGMAPEISAPVKLENIPSDEVACLVHTQNSLLQYNNFEKLNQHIKSILVNSVSLETNISPKPQVTLNQEDNNFIILLKAKMVEMKERRSKLKSIIKHNSNSVAKLNAQEEFLRLANTSVIISNILANYKQMDYYGRMAMMAMFNCEDKLP